MATLLPDIKSTNWQISTAGVGAISEGVADVRQCVDIILRTVKGTDPLRPQFGSDIFQFIDKPMNVAIPNIKKAIIDAVEIWEKRVSILTVTHLVRETGQLDCFITYQLIDSELIDVLRIGINNGFISSDELHLGSIVVNALFPPNPNGKRYFVEFAAGPPPTGRTMSPQCPSLGFATIQELFEWVVANWSIYGRWYLLNDRITGYLNGHQFTGAWIQLSLIATLRFETNVPGLSLGQSYSIGLEVDGVDQGIPPQTFATIEELLNGVRAAWGAFGEWSIEGSGYMPADFDSVDFDSADFLTATGVQYVLVLSSDLITSATITVTV